MKKQYQQVMPMDEESTVIEQFGFLPLSIMEMTRDAKTEWKWGKAYLADGQDETKRGENAKYLPNLKFSEFHAGLAEFIIRYWSIEGNKIIDPFAGRATRAVVSATLDRIYEGYEIAPKTWERANTHLKELGFEHQAKIAMGDGTTMSMTLDNTADLIMTCPPYHRQEKYESAIGQLSDIVEYSDFLLAIQRTAMNCYRVLRSQKFVCWVCADWRDGKAFRSFHIDSVNAFESAGFTLHDMIVIKNHSPFASMQIGKVAASRYTSKIHEILLVFRKP